MRTLKFRIYNPLIKKFSYTKDVPYLESNDWGTFFAIPVESDAEDWVDNYCDDTRNPHCLFQQFTGLLDKNGKGIFEGDILSNDHPYSPYEVKYGERSIITGRTSDFNNIYQKTIGYYLFRLKDKMVFDFFPTNMEIIGNIYELKIC